MVPALAVGRGDEHLQRRVARARAHAGQARIDADRASPARRRWNWRRRARDCGGRACRAASRASAPGHRPGAVRATPSMSSAPPLSVHVDAVRAIALHQLGLLRPARPAIDHVAHHQEARHVHAEIACAADMLLGDVGLGAMGGDTHGARRPARRRGFSSSIVPMPGMSRVVRRACSHAPRPPPRSTPSRCGRRSRS